MLPVMKKSAGQKLKNSIFAHTSMTHISLFAHTIIQSAHLSRLSRPSATSHVEGYKIYTSITVQNNTERVRFGVWKRYSRNAHRCH